MKLKGFFNRDGGTFRTADMDAFVARAEAVFRAAGHEFEASVLTGAEIGPAMEWAAEAGGFDGLIAGGGDGTISTAAGIAWKHGLALGVVPAGTMNLFARSLKLPLDIDAALTALARGRVRGVDIASANGRPFVHQFSAGLHARMVRYRNSLTFASRLGKMRASLRAALGVIMNPPRFEVEARLDGAETRQAVSAIFVSNNRFGQDSLLYAEDVTGGRLGFYIAAPLTPAAAAALALDILRGRLEENEAITVISVPELELHFPRANRQSRCVIDGELAPMPRDVHLKLHPGELKVLVP